MPAGPIYDLLALMENAQFQARDMIQTFDGARTPGSIFKMSETPGRINFAAPRLNQHDNWEPAP